MRGPTREQLAEINAALEKADAAREKGEESRPLYEAAEALMQKYGAAEEPGPLDDEPAPPSNAGNDVLAAAIGMAQEQGDTTTVEKLKALAGKPDELAALIERLQDPPAP